MIASSNLIEWTGLTPQHGVCPGVSDDGAIHSLPLLNLNASRKQILDYFDNGWALTEVLFSGLNDRDAFYRRPIHRLRHPMIFYYVHPAVVYVNKLRVAGLLAGPINPEFEQLFATGVDEMRWDDLHEGRQDIWPSLELACAYRKQVYRVIRHLIETHPQLESAHLPITQQSPLWALVMGFEHERIHLETSSVLIRELPIELVRKPKEWPRLNHGAPHSAPDNTMIAHPAGHATLGKPAAWPSFGWDNEYGAQLRPYPAFCASKHLITNGEFKQFVESGAYSDERFWSPDGWAWRLFGNTKWPTFWVPTGPAGLHQYSLRTTFEIIDLPLNWPVCVNFYEAKAYCAWLTERHQSLTPYRLITEAEHHAIRDTSAQTTSADVAADPVMNAGTEQRYNFNLSTGSEGPVDACPANDKGFHDSLGNVWQWCEDHFHPLPGSKPHPYYEDFSAPCYDGQHQMILGGSFISTGDEASIWSRFHFRPHFFQHSGFRVAQSVERPAAVRLKSSAGNGVYETEEMLNKYLLMHWGSDADIVDEVPVVQRPSVVHLPQKCADLVVQFAAKKGRALDLGCAVGRSTFELARRFDEVLGIDYSHEFIARANHLKTHRQISYWRKDSGSTGKTITHHLDPSIDTRRLRFEHGDACALPSHLNDFDAVLMANVLCRLPNPQACLERMQGALGLVKPGGVLVMTTPFSWLEEYTPRERWLDGLSAVSHVLSDFQLIHHEELPFMIREHRRKFEYIITLASVWRRNPQSPESAAARA